jgi:hypothetical protein
MGGTLVFRGSGKRNTCLDHIAMCTSLHESMNSMPALHNCVAVASAILGLAIHSIFSVSATKLFCRSECYTWPGHLYLYIKLAKHALRSQIDEAQYAGELEAAFPPWQCCLQFTSVLSFVDLTSECMFGKLDVQIKVARPSIALRSAKQFCSADTEY